MTTEAWPDIRTGTGDVVKKMKNRSPQIFSIFFTTSPVPVRMSGQASMVFGPRTAAYYDL